MNFNSSAAHKNLVSLRQAFKVTSQVFTHQENQNSAVMVV